MDEKVMNKAPLYSNQEQMNVMKSSSQCSLMPMSDTIVYTGALCTQSYSTFHTKNWPFPQTHPQLLDPRVPHNCSPVPSLPLRPVPQWPTNCNNMLIMSNTRMNACTGYMPFQSGNRVRHNIPNNVSMPDRNNCLCGSVEKTVKSNVNKRKIHFYESLDRNSNQYLLENSFNPKTKTYFNNGFNGETDCKTTPTVHTLRATLPNHDMSASKANGPQIYTTNVYNNNNLFRKLLSNTSNANITGNYLPVPMWPGTRPNVRQMVTKCVSGDVSTGSIDDEIFIISYKSVGTQTDCSIHTSNIREICCQLNAWHLSHSFKAFLIYFKDISHRLGDGSDLDMISLEKKIKQMWTQLTTEEKKIYFQRAITERSNQELIEYYSQNVCNKNVIICSDSKDVAEEVVKEPIDEQKLNEENESKRQKILTIDLNDKKFIDSNEETIDDQKAQICSKVDSIHNELVLSKTDEQNKPKTTENIQNSTQENHIENGSIESTDQSAGAYIIIRCIHDNQDEKDHRVPKKVHFGDVAELARPYLPDLNNTGQSSNGK